MVKKDFFALVDNLESTEAYKQTVASIDSPTAAASSSFTSHCGQSGQTSKSSLQATSLTHEQPTNTTVARTQFTASPPTLIKDNHTIKGAMPSAESTPISTPGLQRKVLMGKVSPDNTASIKMDPWMSVGDVISHTEILSHLTSASSTPLHNTAQAALQTVPAPPSHIPTPRSMPPVNTTPLPSSTGKSMHSSTAHRPSSAPTVSASAPASAAHAVPSMSTPAPTQRPITPSSRPHSSVASASPISLLTSRRFPGPAGLLPPLVSMFRFWMFSFQKSSSGYAQGFTLSNKILSPFSLMILWFLLTHIYVCLPHVYFIYVGACLHIHSLSHTHIRISTHSHTHIYSLTHAYLLAHTYTLIHSHSLPVQMDPSVLSLPQEKTVLEQLQPRAPMLNRVTDMSSDFESPAWRGMLAALELADEVKTTSSNYSLLGCSIATIRRGFTGKVCTTCLRHISSFGIDCLWPASRYPISWCWSSNSRPVTPTHLLC